jgi:hypothetical protein
MTAWSDEPGRSSSEAVPRTVKRVGAALYCLQKMRNLQAPRKVHLTRS